MAYFWSCYEICENILCEHELFELYKLIFGAEISSCNLATIEYLIHNFASSTKIWKKNIHRESHVEHTGYSNSYYEFIAKSLSLQHI